MSAYFIEPEDLVRGFAMGAMVARCEPVVGELVRRFDLRGKTLMSVGPGTAHEEAAFLRNGMRRAFLFDIDEHGSLEPVLRRIHRPDRRDARLVYFIGDFAARRRRPAELDPIDVLYFSGFTPDELRRGEIPALHGQRPRDGGRRLSLLGRIGARFGRASRDAPVRDPGWPAGISPLHEVVLRAIDRFLTRGGLFILQSYTAGVDPRDNPGYVSEWKGVLRRHGVTLLEGYCFLESPGVTLWIGLKHRGFSAVRRRELERRQADLALRPPLTRFHGRAQLIDCSITRWC